MSITLTLHDTEDLDRGGLIEHLETAQLPIVDDADGHGFVISCADDGTADFWVERATQWGAKVDRTGEADGEHFGTLTPEPVAQPGEADTAVQPS